MKKEKAYLIFDARYHTNPERATILEACETKKEGLESLKDWQEGSVLVEAIDGEEDKIINQVLIHN